MSSERLESNHTDVDPNIAQHELQQSHIGSTFHSSPTAMHDPQQAPTAQLGPPYGLQTGPQNIQESTSTTLAVTNLPYRIRWQDLKDLFRRYGTPSRADVFLAPDGRSRGVGMVSMRTRQEAESCVNDLNGYEWFGRKIGVRIDETGGHHALAAAAMAGATIWEGVSFSHTDYEGVSPQLQTYPANGNTTNPYSSQSTNPVLFIGNLPFSTQWQDLKDLLRPAGRILRADIALAPDGRSKGWGTAVFASPQEAQNAIDTFDGWEVDGRIIKVRWDKYQGSTNQPSPQLVPTTGLSSPQMMHAQLSPAQTPRPNEYVALPSNQAQQTWQSQFLTGNIRPMPSMQPAPPIPMAGPHSHFQSAFVPQQFTNQGPSGNPQVPSGPYPGMLFNGQWYPNYSTTVPPLAPQVRLPSSAEAFNFVPHPAHTQNIQHNESSNSHNVYGI